jgi:methylated-DNA-[protein]-cysteine S-methyltransferase
MSYVFKTMKSPVGLLKLVGSEAGLAAVLWEDDDPKRVRLEATVEAADHPVLVEAERQLGEYFAGKRKTFTVKLDYRGTPFQKKPDLHHRAVPPRHRVNRKAHRLRGRTGG